MTQFNLVVTTIAHLGVRLSSIISNTENINNPRFNVILDDLLIEKDSIHGHVRGFLKIRNWKSRRDEV